MIEVLRDIADEVSAALDSSDRDSWGDDMGMGADGTTTNRIDRIAENAVLSALERHGNPFNVLSEEKGFIDMNREMTLIVDPLDGTYNALHGIPFYAVSLAVSEGTMKDVRWALVRNLISGDEYTATRGGGAFLNGRRIHTRRYDSTSPVFSIFLGKSASQRSLLLASKCKRIRSMGSAALEISMVASGASDMYCYCSELPDVGLRIVDIAAATLILREAGGKVMDKKLIMLDMDTDVRKRSSVLAIGDESLMKVIY